MPQCTHCQRTVAPDAERCPYCGAGLGQFDDVSKADGDTLEGTIQSLLSQGRTIEAIKVYREQTGVGLAAAKDAVERIQRRGSLPKEQTLADSQEQQIVDFLVTGKKIAAIKLYRECTDSGLKEAVDAVEALSARHGIVTPKGSGCLGVLVMVAIVSVVLLGWLSFD